MCEKSEENLTDLETKMFFSIIAYFTQAPNKMFYLSCPSENCKKKVILNDQDTYDCMKCGKSFDKAMPRYIANLKFIDSTGSQYFLTAGHI